MTQSSTDGDMPIVPDVSPPATSSAAAPPAHGLPPWGGAVLVAGAGYLIGAALWAARHESAYRALVRLNRVEPSDMQRLVINVAVHIAAALAAWALIAVAVQRRGVPARPAWRDALSAAALVFVPFWLHGVSLAAFWVFEARFFARSVHALALGLALTLLWRLFAYRPWSGLTDPPPAAPRPSGPGAWKPARWSLPARMVALGIALYAIHFTQLSWLRYMNFHAALKDLGMYTQQLWGALQGRMFLCSVYELPNDNMLAEHVMPIVMALAPLYALWTDPRMLLLIQAVFVALAAWPLYQIGLRFGLNRAMAMIPALSWLMHPMIQSANLYDFHPDALAPFFVLMTFLAMLDRRWKAYWVLAFLAIMCKEDVALPVALIGVYAALTRRHWALGAVTVALAGVWFIVSVDVIVPHFRETVYRHGDRYLHLVAPYLDADAPKPGLFQIAWIMLLHPVWTISHLFTAARVNGLLELLGPVVGMALLGPLELFIALPAIAANLLAEHERQHGFNLHYPFSMAPFLYVASASGLARLGGLGGRRFPGRFLAMDSDRRKARVAFWAVAMLLASVTFCYWNGQTVLSRRHASRRYRVGERYAVGRDLARQVPPGAAVSAQTTVGTHLTHRFKIYEFPHVRDADWIVLDLGSLQRGGSVWPFADSAAYVALLEEYLTSGDWGVALEASDYVALQSGYATDRNAAILDRARELMAQGR